MTAASSPTPATDCAGPAIAVVCAIIVVYCACASAGESERNAVTTAWASDAVPANEQERDGPAVLGLIETTGVPMAAAASARVTVVHGSSATAAGAGSGSSVSEEASATADANNGAKRYMSFGVPFRSGVGYLQRIVRSSGERPA